MEILRKIRKALSRHGNDSVPEFPQNIFLEPTNACNLRCRMCGVWGEDVTRKREVGFIKKDVWVNAIEEIGSWPVNINLDLHGAGEPLLHPEFFDIISLAKSKNNITVGFLSNGTLLDDEKKSAIIDTRVDWVGFSVDGAQKEIFEYYRRGADFDETEENIKGLLSLRRNMKPDIFLNMVAHSDADIDAFIERWAGRVETIMIAIKKTVHREENFRVKLRRPCPLIYQQVVMGWNGTTGLCCEDCWGDYITGKFPEKSLYDIWHGRSLNMARRLHDSGRCEEIYLCKTCDTGFFHKYEEIEIEKAGKKTLVRKELPEINPDYGQR